jgi:phasin family protein
MNVINSLKEKAELVVESSEELKNTGVDILEKSSKAALESYRFYSDLGLQQLRALVSIHDLTSLRTYIGQSVSASGEVFKHAVEDIQNNIALTSEFRSSLSGALSGAMKSTSNAVMPKGAMEKSAAAAKQKTSAAA